MTTESNVIPFSEPDAPCQPILWRVLVKPLAPKEQTDSGIVLPDEIQDAERQLTVVGQVVRMGGLAFKAETKAGLRLRDEPNSPKPGMWVLCHQYAGQKVWADDTEYRLLNDTEILAVTETPDAFRGYL